MDPNLIYGTEYILYVLFIPQYMFRYDLFINISFIMGTIVALRYVQNFVKAYTQHQCVYKTLTIY